MALNQAAAGSAATAPRSAVLRRLRLTDQIFHGLTRGAALGVLALLGGVIVALIIGAARAVSPASRRLPASRNSFDQL